jgi:anti-anti-sigma factor
MAPRRPDRPLDPGFSLEVHPERGRVRLEVHGELDVLTVRPVRQRVAEFVGAGFGEIVIDLRGLSFIDSTGMRLLLTLHLQARRDGWGFALIRGPETVQRVFDIAGTATVLPFIRPPS